MRTETNEWELARRSIGRTLTAVVIYTVILIAEHAILICALFAFLAWIASSGWMQIRRIVQMKISILGATVDVMYLPVRVLASPITSCVQYVMDELNGPDPYDLESFPYISFREELRNGWWSAFGPWRAMLRGVWASVCPPYFHFAYTGLTPIRGWLRRKEAA